MLAPRHDDRHVNDMMMKTTMVLQDWNVIAKAAGDNNKVVHCWRFLFGVDQGTECKQMAADKFLLPLPLFLGMIVMSVGVDNNGRQHEHLMLGTPNSVK